MVPILGSGNLVLRGDERTMPVLRDLLQATAFRLLAGVPAGRMRLTLIDPVGLGQSFAHMLRLDEMLRGPMARHKPAQIEEVIEETTSHVSMLIQKYLRDEYADIEAWLGRFGGGADAVPVTIFLCVAAHRMVSTWEGSSTATPTSSRACSTPPR